MLFCHYIYAKEARQIWHQGKLLFEKLTGNILSRQKFIFQLIDNFAMKKISIGNVVANPFSINLDLL